MAGYGKKTVSSPFELAGPLTEALLMANLAIRGYDIRRPKATGAGFDYPGRGIELLWDTQQLQSHQLRRRQPVCEADYRPAGSAGQR